MKTKLGLAIALLFLSLETARAQYTGWQHSGSLWILTTPEGAELPATCTETSFPLLVRLDRTSFDFAQAKTHGEDIRFSDSGGAALAYQIEEWDAAGGAAKIWVKIPVIKGNARQEIKMHWGKEDAVSESNGLAVFNADNGFCSVLHMNDPVKDELGTVTAVDAGTTATVGMIGKGRHFPGGKGIACGTMIPNLPTGSSSHSTELWIRAEVANSTLIGWGNEGGNRGSKVRMLFRSPPHVHIDSDFSDVNGEGTLPLGQWIHVVHTYSKGDGRIYINGKLDGAAKPMLNIKTPGRMWIGGWYNNYDFIGDIDEVRISRVARSADWVKLEYENQKALQTLVGSLVKSGDAFSVSSEKLELAEGKSVMLTAQAGGAQKVYWILKRDGVERVAAVDQLSYTIDAGRVTGDSTMSLQFKAVYAGETRVRDISVTIKEEIPEPVVTLKAPSAWNGRDTIEVLPVIGNLAAMEAKGAAELKYTWTVMGGAVIKEIAPDKLILIRSQYTGPITVKASVSNGGAEAIATADIVVTEPKSDPWIARAPEKDEKPQDNQFYARDDKNEGTLFYNGTLDKPADSVFLKVYADGAEYKVESHDLAPDKSYAFTVKLKPGLIKYKVEFGTRTGKTDTVTNTASNLVCGDAYIIQGQSNAVAFVHKDAGAETPADQNDWIRSYGNMDEGSTRGGWGNAAGTRPGGRDHGICLIGYWGADMARHLVTRHKMPICIFNGAVGGTRVDQHQRNPADPFDAKTIYGRMLTRVKAAGLTHGIRGILWHQGENNQGAACPTGDYDWKSYQQYFVDLAAAWKQDFPNIQHYYIYQVWPTACSMGGTKAGDMLLEVQRTLPALFSNMRSMSTLGIVSKGTGKAMCHFDAEGYAQVATLMEPLVEQDNYGVVSAQMITAPNLIRASFTNAEKTEVALEFSQPMAWNDAAKDSIYCDYVKAPISAGKVSGNVILLQLSEPSKAKSITYIKGKDWDGKPKTLLFGANGIAAFTFCDVAAGVK